MILDIGSLVRIADSRRTLWSPESASIVAWVVSLQVSALVDWDHDAGERWIRLTSDGLVVGYFDTVVPLAWVANRVSVPFPVVLIPSSSEALSLEVSIGANVFGERFASDVIDSSNFSFEDLWYVST